MISYNITEKKHFCHAGLDQLIDDVRKENNLLKTFKSCLIHLAENNHDEKHQVLKSELKALIPKVLVTGDNLKVLKLAVKVFLLNPEIKTPKLNISSLENLIVQTNMRIPCYVETVVRNEEPEEELDSVISLAVLDPLVAIVYANNKIKLWDLDQKKWLWRQVKPDGSNEIKMFKDHIIFKNRLYDVKDRSENGFCKIEVICIKTGDIKPPFYVNSDQVLLMEDRIFCLLENDVIEEWDLDGKRRQSIPLEKRSDQDLPLFLGNERFLVVIDANNEIIIHDLQKNRQKKLQLSKEAIISSSHIDKYHLICGFESSSCPDACVIDLKSGCIVNQFKTPTEKGKEVTKILSANERIYLGYSTGELAIFNLAENKYYPLGKHLNGISYLFLDEEVLLSGSKEDWNTEMEVKAWDTVSKMHIVDFSLAPLAELAFHSGKLYLADESSLIRRNFLSQIK